MKLNDINIYKTGNEIILPKSDKEVDRAFSQEEIMRNIGVIRKKISPPEQENSNNKLQ